MKINRHSQEQKSKILAAKPRKAQEEMVGFALIIIIVAVILLIFLGFSLKKPQKQVVESYEVESFIQTFLQYTSDCRNSAYLEYLSIRELIFACNRQDTCLDKRNSCDVLGTTLTDIVEESWKTGQKNPIKGYELEIIQDEEEIISQTKGNITNSSKGAMQPLSRGIEIHFTAYY